MIEIVGVAAIATLMCTVAMLQYRVWREARVLAGDRNSFLKWLTSRAAEWASRRYHKWDQSASRRFVREPEPGIRENRSPAGSRALREGSMAAAVFFLLISVLLGHSEMVAAIFIAMCLVTYCSVKIFHRLMIFRRRAHISRIMPDFIRSIRTTDGLTSTGLIAHAVKAWNKRPNSHALYNPLQATAWLASTGYSWSHALSTVCEELSDSVAIPVVVGFKRGLDSTNHEAKKFLDEAEVVAGAHFERLLDVWGGEVVRVIHGASAVCMAALVVWLLA